MSVFPTLLHALREPDSQGASQRIGSYSTSHVQAYLDSDRSCTLCRLALTVLSDHEDFHDNMRYKAFSLWAVNVLNEEERLRAVGYDEQDFVTGLYVKHTDTSGRLGPDDDIKNMDNPYKRIRREGLLMPMMQSHSPFGVRMLDPGKLDIRTVKSWMKQCDDEHEKCKRSGSMKDMVGLKVIDCKEKRIISHDGAQSYIALSYIWGPPSKPLNLSLSKCPRLITEVMEATHKLGYRYLWVDRYCIDQSNELEKTVQLAQMDLVYENAELTIVSAAGDDRDGLPGIGSDEDPCLRKKQALASLGPVTLAWTMPDIEHHLEKARWTTRGWTYQEALLSRRCLIFFPNQVFFACQTMCRSETLPNFPTLRENDIRNLTLQTIFAPDDGREDSTRYLGKPLDPNDENLRYHAKMFATRELTYDTDAMNACMGFLKRATIPSYYGVPILQSISPDVRTSLDSQSNQMSLGSAPPPIQYIPAGFCMGLLWWTWDSEETSRRRVGLPSWTWLDIKGSPIDFRYPDLGCLPKDVVCAANISIEDGKSWTPFLELVSSHVDSGKILPTNGKRLLIEAPTTTLISIYGELGDYYARLGSGHESVLADLKLDCESSIPRGFFGRFNSKWQGIGQRQGVEHDARKLDWAVVQLLDMRNVIKEGKVECLVLQKIGLVYERIGILHTDKALPDTRIEQIILE
jgi:hypothetical protein